MQKFSKVRGLRFTRRAKQLGIPTQALRELLKIYREEYLIQPRSFEQLLEVLE